MLLDPLVVGEEHYRIAERAREALARFKDLQDIIALLGVEELGAADRLIVKRARRLQRFLSQPFVVTEAFTGTPGPQRHVAPTRSPAAAPSSTARPTTGRKARSTWSERWTRRAQKEAAAVKKARVMRLRIITPLSVVVDEDGVLALRAEDASGSFGILPRPRGFPDQPGDLAS